MPRYRTSFFVQHHQDEPNIGCHITVKIDARTPDGAVVAGMAGAVKICMEHHPELDQPWRPILKHRPVEMKALREAKSS